MSGGTITALVSLAACLICARSARRGYREVLKMRALCRMATDAAHAWREVAFELVTPSGVHHEHNRRWCSVGCAGRRDSGHLFHAPGVFGLGSVRGGGSDNGSPTGRAPTPRDSPDVEP